MANIETSSRRSTRTPIVRIIRKWAVPVLMISAFLLAGPSLAAEAVLFAGKSLLTIAPAVLIALGVTAFASATGAIGLIASSFRGKQARMIGLASIVGALTPVCGISVYPLVAGLLAARVPLAPIMAFWLSSPVTDPGMLVITAATLGWPFAIGKTAAALLCGLVGGFVVLVAVRCGFLSNPARQLQPSALGMTCGGCDAPDTVLWSFWRENPRMNVFIQTLKDNGRLMLVWLSLAFVAEFFMRLYVPDAWITSLVGRDAEFAVPFAALIGAPIYLEGYAALPLLRELIDSGMKADAAMTFLVAGGIISAWAAIPVFSLVRLPIFGLYVVLAVFCSMLAGWGFGLFV